MRKAARKLERERKKIEMGSDFEDSGNDGDFKKVEEDSWDNSSESEEDDEYGSDVEQSQLERYDGDGTGSQADKKVDNTQYGQAFLDKAGTALIDESMTNN